MFNKVSAYFNTIDDAEFALSRVKSSACDIKKAMLYSGKNFVQASSIQSASEMIANAPVTAVNFFPQAPSINVFPLTDEFQQKLNIKNQNDIKLTVICDIKENSKVGNIILNSGGNEISYTAYP